MKSKNDISKENLSPSKGRVPRLRFPEFMKYGIWTQVLLGDFFDLYEEDKKAETFDKQKIITVRLHGLGAIKNERTDSLSGGANYFKRKKGQFIFSKIDLLNGAFGIIPEELDGFYSSSDVPAITFNEDALPDYFLYLMHAKYKQLNIERTGTSSTLKRVSRDSLLDVCLWSPNKPEQKKIAACLSSLDALIAAHGKKLENLKAYKKGLMQRLFPAEGERVPRLRFSGVKEEWEIVPLGRTGDNLDNRRIPITENERTKGSIPYYGASGIVDYVDGFIFDEDILCISEDGANLVARTYPIAFSVSGKSWVNNHSHVMKFSRKEIQIIIENYLNSIELSDFLTGMAQPKLNRAMLDVIPIPLPKEKSEQQKIAATLSALDNLIGAQVRKIEELKEHKQGLMQGLFPEMDDEVHTS